MDVHGILERLKLAFDVENNYQLSTQLEISPSTINGWINREQIPFHACYVAFQQTGASMEWLITGRGKMLSDMSVPAVEQEKLIDDFAYVLKEGEDLGLLLMAEDSTKEVAELLGRMLYRKYTGNKVSPKVTRNKAAKV